jgi:hypothetical protein
MRFLSELSTLTQSALLLPFLSLTLLSRRRDARLVWLESYKRVVFAD